MGVAFFRVPAKQDMSGLHVFFLLDCSDPVVGVINSTVDAVNAMLPELRKVTAHYSKMHMKARVLCFSSGASFSAPQAVDIDKFRVTNIFPGGSKCELGKAFDMLYDQLKQITPESGGQPPFLVLISNGHPTDNYKASLERLRELQSFRCARRMAFAIGPNPSRRMLEEFTGLEINVRDIDNLDAIPRAFAPAP
ncbi:MAG: hypothetical protein K6A35_05435 [bacterium]|nr:hypothetical protein [bacterium]